jgi:hypothetical protein
MQLTIAHTAENEHAAFRQCGNARACTGHAHWRGLAPLVRCGVVHVDSRAGRVGVTRLACATAHSVHAASRAAQAVLCARAGHACGLDPAAFARRRRRCRRGRASQRGRHVVDLTRVNNPLIVIEPATHKHLADNSTRQCARGCPAHSFRVSLFLTNDAEVTRARVWRRRWSM